MGGGRRRAAGNGLIAVATALLASCGGSAPSPAVPTTATTATTATTGTAAPPDPAVVDVPIRLERHVADAATDGFEALARATMTDPRGWEQAGFRFTFGPNAAYTVVLAEGDVVDALCRPYDVGRRYSCQNGPVVALNADRWRTATPEWTGSLEDYRRMLVNHEVGHLVGRHHPDVQCPGPGQPAPLMAQQSTELDGCLPNPWPLPWEVRCAARHDEPLAPGYEPDAVSTCGGER